jgi:hypothetical protein
MSPEVAQLGHAGAVASCPLLGAQQTTSARIGYFAF